MQFIKFTKKGLEKIMEGGCGGGYISGNLEVKLQANGSLVDINLRDTCSGKLLGSISGLSIGDSTVVTLVDFEVRTGIKIDGESSEKVRKEKKVMDTASYVDELTAAINHIRDGKRGDASLIVGKVQKSLKESLDSSERSGIAAYVAEVAKIADEAVEEGRRFVVDMVKGWPEKEKKSGPEPFWVVWGVGIQPFRKFGALTEIRDSTPSVRHESEEIAVKEAERLAVKHPEKEFHVLRSVSTSSASDIKTVFHKEG